MLPRASDPLELARRVEELVLKRSSTGRILRRYYGFSRGRWYGGSSAGYAIGCNLDCAFCWAWFKDRHDLGVYLTPEDVVRRLVAVGARVVRLSGGEPTIGFDHLIEVLKGFTGAAKHMRLVVETNGILVGASGTYAGELGRFSGDVVVRVSIKGANPETFSSLTGSPPEYFGYQLRAVKSLVDSGYRPGRDLLVAVMSSFNSPREIAELLYALSSIDEALAESVELELIRLYSRVKAKLRARGLAPLRYLDQTDGRRR